MPTSQQQLNAAFIDYRVGTYRSRVNAREQNEAETTRAEVQPGYTPILNPAAYFSPIAVVKPYSTEPNSGPKDGIRPIYFLDLNYASSTTVDVTISGTIVSYIPNQTFELVATGILSTLPLDAFLAAVVANATVNPDISLTVERSDTCLSVVGNIGVEIEDQIQVVIS